MPFTLDQMRGDFLARQQTALEAYSRDRCALLTDFIGTVSDAARVTSIDAERIVCSLALGIEIWSWLPPLFIWFDDRFERRDRGGGEGMWEWRLCTTLHRFADCEQGRLLASVHEVGLNWRTRLVSLWDAEVARATCPLTAFSPVDDLIATRAPTALFPDTRYFCKPFGGQTMIERGVARLPIDLASNWRFECTA